jgi:hypothetical protein
VARHSTCSAAARSTAVNIKTQNRTRLLFIVPPQNRATSGTKGCSSIANGDLGHPALHMLAQARRKEFLPERIHLLKTATRRGAIAAITSGRSKYSTRTE